jgi:hypothetical protein
MAQLEQRLQQLESEVRELQAMLKIDRQRIDRLANRLDKFFPEVSGPSAEDIQSAFGGRVFGVIGHLGEYGGSGGAPGALRSLSLRFTVEGEDVQVETATEVPPEEQALARFHEQNALVGLAFRALGALVPESGEVARPPLPLTLTFEERAARLRVCGREQDFRSFVCGDRSVAWARIGDLRVTVELPTAFLDSQTIELHDKAEFEPLTSP